MTRATAAASTLPPPDKDPLSEQVFVRTFEQSNEGMLVTDSRNLIVAFNGALSRLSGYSPEELVGQNPRILSSGRASPEFYAAMWQALENQDYWEGEIWNKQKDGANYPRRLKISVLRNADGSIRNYVANYTEIAASHEVADRLAYLAYHDPLTNLPNRLAFESQLAQSLRSCAREGKQMALMLIDLDNFKNINDTLGHHVGDQLLQNVALRLRECVRASDLVARIGGDEFVVVLPDIESPLTAARVASKIQSNLADSYRIADHVLYATPSIGISLYPIDGGDPGTLLRNADTAMYHAKSAGRNNHQFYTARMNEAAGERLAMENELRQAIAAISPASSEFSLHFQPQIETVSGRVLGIEALLRWNNAKFGSVSPMRFITIAEETGLIQPLGDWVIWETCRLIRVMKQRGIAGIRVAINISAQQLRHENLLLLVRGALACYDLEPEDIELEVTESTAMENPEMTLSILDQLAAMGIVLAIDDFGTGYSSLAYLKHLPIKRLKLDRSFVKDIETDVNDAAICTATIALGHSLGLELVAEGVETEAQRDFLAGLGCDFLQGYLYSRPMPFDDTVAYLKAHLAAQRR
ncbi:putative bifunctional diguanylate cyclase/phosphodiesterase [Ferribacterium limneticum]|uniref:putative bifunctional diguanylate cyclase/phosphodiesterase n=1 Tax=Ferribacterium limneticum TaxID=76259 RepID=UPI001CF90987|nr:EAL domain-containing protein [Ferribacterium limneticum]UCV22491.1 EAL domain-containing protein [Ferribacterium limneticum]